MKLKRVSVLVTLGVIVVGLVAFPIGCSIRADRQSTLDTELLTNLRFSRVQDVRSLLQEGADPNTRDLGLAKPESPYEHLLALITRSHNSVYERAPTALSYAMSNWGSPNPAHRELLKLLLDYGADVKLSEHCDQPPFDLALQWNDIETVKLFLEHGADANAQFGDRSALRIGISTEDPQIVQLLLDHGARIQMKKDKHGLTDLDEARRQIVPEAYIRYRPYYNAAQCRRIVTILTNASKTHSK